jgi:hypothetical protein
MGLVVVSRDFAVQALVLLEIDYQFLECPFHIPDSFRCLTFMINGLLLTNVHSIWS